MATTAMAQDITICDICEASPVQMNCSSCATNLCKGCMNDHLSNEKTERGHNLVIYKKKNTKPIFPKCETHKEQNCEMKCNQCEIPVCLKCLAPGSHNTHDLTYLLETYNSQKDIIKQATTKLESAIYPKYKKLITELEVQMDNLPKRYATITSEMTKQGEEWHREVDIIINQSKQKVEKMKTDDLATLKKLLEEMKNLLSTLRQAIGENNDILQSADVTKVLDSKYTSPEMWDPTPSIDVTPPTFTPLPIQGEQLLQMFGTLTALSMPPPLSPIKMVQDKLAIAVKQLQLLDSPESPSIIHTGCKYLGSITCLSPDEFCVSVEDGLIKRFTNAGTLQETVTTTTDICSLGITVSRQGDLIYPDDNDRSINRVRQGEIEKIISLQEGWIPLTVCCTESDELLITMGKNHTPSRVVRYLGDVEKQVIQFDDQGEPLFSTFFILFIAENSDKDMICVSDTKTDTLVVVNQAGKLRFRHTGNIFFQKYRSFSPRGVVIDSMGHILVADDNNDCIHIIDQQGHFIRYIDNCQLSEPEDLSLDRYNTLYVAERYTAKVKVIKYLT